MTTQAAACEFRPAEESDYDAIAEVWHAGASLPGVGPASMPTEAALRERLGREVAAGWRMTVALSAGAIVGFLAIKPSEAVLAELFVRPGSIGSGVGRALLAQAMEAMPEGFTLYTRSANARARRFYETAGLVALREGTHPHSGDPMTYYGWNSGRGEA